MCICMSIYICIYIYYGYHVSLSLPQSHAVECAHAPDHDLCHTGQWTIIVVSF